VRVIARLRPGVTVTQAIAEAAVLFQQYRRENASNTDASSGGHLEFTALQESIVSDIRPTLLIIAAAVGLVLLIACANVAGLMLARATGRAREIALRAAIGASRRDLIGQLLAESILLSTAGAVAGAILASWGVSLLSTARGIDLPNVQPVRVDLPVLAFTLGVAVLTGVLFGLIPAIQASRPDLNAMLRDSGGGAAGGRSRNRVRGVLVAGQIALSIVLLIGAGLLIQSLRQLLAQNPGFNPHDALTLSVNLPASSYPDDIRRSQFVRDVLSRLEALPGVQSASASLGLPLSVGVMAPILPEGQPSGLVNQRPVAVWYAVSPDYFKTLGIPILRGRPFTWADDARGPKTIIVSESTARRYWPNENPVGKHVTYARREVPAEVVGVAGDVKTRGLDADPGLAFYTPYPQFAWLGITFTLRTTGDPHQFANSAAAQVFAVDRNQAVTGIRTLEDSLSAALSQRRQTLYLIGGFAGIALLLALIGLYGVMSYTVAQRSAEIGIRQAIGAQRTDILRMVMGQGLRLSVAGILSGGLAALWLTRFLARMLFHVRATDPLTFATIAVLFLAIALAASWIPAWRATRIDPVDALRAR
jgi:predicted permease